MQLSIPNGGSIYFDIVSKEGVAIFRIQDEGIGIPMGDRDRLFHSFHRASNVGNISGTGLGLAIVKKSVDLHGGQIYVKAKSESARSLWLKYRLTRNKGRGVRRRSEGKE
ncbi:MAG: Sensor histidine kinase RcsC [Chroococcidiopsis sp. SAG 2025]|uniref:sensor histidine kinase n=1 Tax=Chroococcidiopsis sp. SAG 2025 TaxID=171389 RepID=UPI002936E29C|nr:sensor histidine kinase [Chroococcidiopsis sp. SAG 2025]MDV2993474.1 Sensor histidine kinase RcsC [Chroococcidiopsis sp. SAG 2025]